MIPYANKEGLIIGTKNRAECPRPNAMEDSRPHSSTYPQGYVTIGISLFFMEPAQRTMMNPIRFICDTIYIDKEIAPLKNHRIDVHPRDRMQSFMDAVPPHFLIVLY